MSLECNTWDWQFEYLKGCDKQMIVPLAELTAKSMRPDFHLINYSLNDGSADAIG
jgi:hypothetical protein